MGAGEAAFEYLFRYLLGAAEGTGTNLAFLYHIVAAASRLLGLPFYLASGRDITRTDMLNAQAPAAAAKPEKPG